MLCRSKGIKLLALVQGKIFKFRCHFVDNLFHGIFNLRHPGVKVIIGLDGGGLVVFEFLVEQVQCSGDLCGHGLKFRVQFQLEFSKDRVCGGNEGWLCPFELEHIIL